MSLLHKPARLLLVLALFTASACVETNSVFRTAPTFYPTAERNYEAGLKELKNSNWITAEQFFVHIKNSFAFSKWATLAELGIADSNMGRDKFTEAIDDYKAFMRAHPSHERVQDGYAAFRIGEAYHKQIPSDWFIVPPSYEKDQGPVIDAMRELGAFREQFADSPYREKAQKLYDNCVGRLADHELYVAGFYLKMNKPMAAIGRLEGVVQKFPGAKREPETLLLMGKTYIKLNKPVEARNTLVKLANEHPNDKRAKKAKKLVAELDKKYPVPVDSPDKADPKSKDPKAAPGLPDTGAREEGGLAPTPTSPKTTSPATPSNTSPAAPPPAQ